MNAFTLPSIPSELNWINQPLDWKAGPGNQLTVVAGKVSDWFIDPAGNSSKGNAPCALFSARDENYILSACVKVEFASTFDAGVLFLRESDSSWGKLCFEYSPQGKPMVVSVVTREFSDDCNSIIVEGNTVFLRAAVTPRTIAFHYSHDGKFWHFVRYFTLGASHRLAVGFSSQSPTGAKCTANFTDIVYQSGILKDLRNGE